MQDDAKADADEIPQAHGSPEPYSIHGSTAKHLIVLAVSIAGCFSPLATTMYLPAFHALAKDLHQPIVLINLSMTTYLIFQGISPALLGPLTDRSGRRPMYIMCFIIYIASNIGLALQNHYAAFLTLRAMQSAGVSNTIALATAVITDITTATERGVTMGCAFAGFLAGQTLSPVLGGILTNYLGWRWIFWFLTICSATFFLVLLLFLPETSRPLVGNGSRRPPRSSLCLLDLTNTRRHGSTAPPLIPNSGRGLSRWNPFAALLALRDRAVFLVVMANGINFCGSVAITTSQPSQFKEVYALSDLHIGLCFLPFGIGGIVASYVQGRLTDFNYRRHVRRCSNGNERCALDRPTLARARAQMVPPLAVAQCLSAVAYGWMLHYSVPIACPLVFLFLLGYTGGAMINCLNVLTTDLCIDRPATATAMTNMVRCLMGAGISAAIGPLIEASGRGWAFTVVPGLLSLLCIPPLIFVMWGASVAVRAAHAS
ncbi:MFS transporter [Aspergillus campestris IBT 28561]|uniref:MFS transporter n=1 Tax=Aspergillus campestris (strain IBT 28561) TaxID=1392248 RepID=A0A2I1D545_ASPC2|nr:MFS transporter [Aspergillus campestris IBT 28561]PKY05001.1 MFS transporter [Aspergillus campestris IBT 28561]